MVEKSSRILPKDKEKLKNLFGKRKITAAYCFGSRAEGTATEKSDYDFAVLVDHNYDQDNINITLMDVKEEAAALFQKEVDLVLLNTATIEFKYLVIYRGQVIYSMDEEKRTDFEDEVIRDYLDYKPVLELYRKEVREAIKEGNFYG